MGRVVQVSGLSKAYRLGEYNTGSLALDLKRWWALTRGKEDPFLKIGEENDRTTSGSSNIVWSLKDVNLSINQGDTVGIIGKNGAGKSTLLKLLSQVTHPTAGRIHIRGKVASLLEVGTGFHPELTGRENVFLNGAILGMRKKEISAKFDEIVSFSGVERYIDTPVKRYSSGMFVRLAFAVAAHLESEILIVDEVLAVGDADFQRKCMSKMDGINSDEGRTIIFVSHNMTSIKALCKSSILLNKGSIDMIGPTETVIQRYQTEGISNATERIWKNNEAPQDNGVILHRVAAYPDGKKPRDIIRTSDNIIIELDFQNLINKRKLDITLDLFDSSGVHVSHFGTICDPKKGLSEGKYRTSCIIPRNLLNSNQYIIHLTVGLNQRQVLLKMNDLLILDVQDGIPTRGSNYAKLPGVIHPIIPWETLALH